MNPAIDTSEVLPLLDALRGVEREVRSNANKRLRQAARECAQGLVLELRAAGAQAPTPQARIVARTARVSPDRIPVVQIGGTRAIGRRRTPAGRLVWGSERGGPTFGAPYPGEYWIAPTAAAYARTGAPAAYQRAVIGILRDAGVL